jgi:hypothetical protein
LTCLYGNSTSSLFDLEPPALQDYFAWSIALQFDWFQYHLYDHIMIIL